MAFARVQHALREMAAGRIVILVDDEGRENEGDFCLAADCTMPADINFMVTYGRGLVCLALSPRHIERLALPMMVRSNTSSFGTAFTVSIEAAKGVSTGISAADRAHTIRAAINEASGPTDLARPGHMFPLRARAGGVLARDGQTEGSVDLARLAGRADGAVICEVLNEDGSMARRPELEQLAGRHGLAIVSVAELIGYRLATEQVLRASVSKTTHHPSLGRLTFTAFVTPFDGREHLLLTRGLVRANPPDVGDAAAASSPAAAALGSWHAAAGPANELPAVRLHVGAASANVAATDSLTGPWPAWLAALSSSLAAPRAAVALCSVPGGPGAPFVAWLTAQGGQALPGAGRAPAAGPPGEQGAANAGASPGELDALADPSTGGHAVQARGVAGAEGQFRWQMGVAAQMMSTLPPFVGELAEGSPRADAAHEALSEHGLRLAAAEGARRPEAMAPSPAQQRRPGHPHSNHDVL